ncbi:uncharacterized protein LOC115875751 [Sitophilus oryzae]|uniref:Uncharacterized protein LOC115875751 n=1 Tax=Sitophilus oryzae TaxID=7048 RepID=A0A6J2X7A6_SITOR|nr:uncharacterized protein LOC115875751 [Sitophilus oryzae]
MSGGNLRMSDAETLKFLELYRNEPVLWDPTNRDYKKRDRRVAAAQRIADTLNLPGFTPPHVITKFKNLRSSYAQELKKISGSKKSGISADDVYMPKVIWFREMDAFLRPYVKARSTQSNLSSQSRASHEIKLYDDETQDPQIEPHFQEVDVATDPAPQPGPLNESRCPTQATKHFTKLQSPNTARTASEAKFKSTTISNNPETPLKKLERKERVLQKKRNVENETLELLMSAIDKLDRISKRATAEKEDNFDYFGKYIASLLRTLPIQQALSLQQEMITLALNAHRSISAPAPSPLSPSNDQSQGDDFSPQSEDTWISELSTAMDTYN